MQPYMRPMQLRPVRLFHRQNTVAFAETSEADRIDASAEVSLPSSSTPVFLPRRDGRGQDTAHAPAAAAVAASTRDVAVFAFATTGSSGNASCNTVRDNLRKWQSFGMNTTRYAMADVSAPTPMQPGNAAHVSQCITAGVAEGGSAPAPVAASADVPHESTQAHDLRHKLREVAVKVVNNTEAARCGQPQRQSPAGGFRGGGYRGGRREGGRGRGRTANALDTPPRNERGKEKPQKSGEDRAEDEDEEGALLLKDLCKAPKESPGTSRRGRGKEHGEAGQTVATSGGEDAAHMGREEANERSPNESHEEGSGSSRKKRGRRSAAAAAEKDDGVSAGRPSHGAAGATTTKGTKSRKRSRKAGEEEAGLTLHDLFAPREPGHKNNKSSSRGGGGGGAVTQSRSLFSFPHALSSLIGDGRESADESAAAFAVPYEELQDTNALFNDLARALNDPDRIQAPPLFVGLLLRPPYSHSNFSLSAVSGGKAHFVPAVDPRIAHRVVQCFALRWRDKAYVVPASPLGFELLLRVLRELPGVELITFHAPALLLPLLGYLAERQSSTLTFEEDRETTTLVTQCVSDVRVMGWMAHITESDGSEAAVADCAVLQRLCGAKGAALLPRRPNVGGGRGSRDLVGSTLQELVNQVYTLAPLYSVLYGQLGAKGLLQAFLRQEKRIALLLAIMKRDGFFVDLGEVAAFKASCAAHMNAIRDAACALVPELPEFNIQSHEHCRQAIYELLQLGKYLMDDNGSTAANVSITKGGKLSTAEETLRLLAPRHPFPRLLLRYRKVAKIQQTYLEGMMSLAIPCTEGENNEEEKEKEKEKSSDCNAAGNTEADLFSDSAAVQLGEPPQSELVDAGKADTGAAAEERISALGDAMQKCVRAGSGSNGSSPRAASLPTHGYARLHANFLQEGTDTGRLSCVEPNLQNIPRCALTLSAIADITRKGTDTDAEDNGKEEEDEGASSEVREADAGVGAQAEWVLDFRRCFVAPPRYCLLSVDYGQIELRVLAHLCEDAALVAAMTQATDIHRRIAEMVFKKAHVTPEERNLSKRVVFGIIYGAGPRTLAAQMDLRVEDALHISSLLKAAFPRIAAYHQRVIDQSRQDGFVRTMSGRLRYLPELNSTVMVKRAYAERQAFNTVVQGSAADVMKMGMLAIEHDVLHRYGSAVQLLTQIHDEVILAVRTDILREVVPKVMHAMTHAVSLLVPLRVTAKVGPSLAQLEEWSVDHDLGIRDVV